MHEALHFHFLRWLHAGESWGARPWLHEGDIGDLEEQQHGALIWVLMMALGRGKAWDKPWLPPWGLLLCPQLGLGEMDVNEGTPEAQYLSSVLLSFMGSASDRDFPPWEVRLGPSASVHSLPLTPTAAMPSSAPLDSSFW